ncbi:DinB family protein [Chryseobacterium suipulveris]|uniref:DinB family protein n=1 Tax=Chryseobacterium suipulveris TaxID=2929800 RepID=A0ABY4BWE7_9FLAO|nr:DinB family protein [Chryseobacterium suipulveris]UOE42011.1 DinB family protein [Chryseobacterium suipulveris]
MQSAEVIKTVSEQAKLVIEKAEQLANLDLRTLTWRSNESSWNILECLEHLNLYGEYYLPQIENKIQHSTPKEDLEFRSGILGNYFVQSMK